jgi:hypothetical protein
MAHLMPPTTTVHRSFLAAMAEFPAEGRGGSDDGTMIGRDHRIYGRLGEPSEDGSAREWTELAR